ncbi:Uncharacterized protein TCM_025681 [Theobroma cacao]|uniref:Reverse transcriptase zinc-binding domain-containing protein n=1 Tax=Theobroma cacao TaxID=3641 RepID=A0A061F084_THECC|nr:Uncharacterized protein TCM_025681 [Theobroma cacao]
MDLELKNHALLNKCLWRYANEPDSLWRKVIWAKNRLDPGSMLPSSKPHRPSLFRNQISKSLQLSNRYHDLVTMNFGSAPPKVESFCWQVLKGKMGAKSILMERGLMIDDEAK